MNLASPKARPLLILLAAGLCTAGHATGQDPIGPPAPAGGAGPSISLDLGGNGLTDPDGLGSALEVVLFMTLLSLAPAIVLTMTCFTRILVVLSFLRRAMSVQELPPAIVVTGFSFFLTLFVMAPVVEDLKTSAYDPYVAREIGIETALDRAGSRMNRFMLSQTRPADLELVLDLSRTAPPQTPDDVPFHVAVPAFVLSEVKTAFQMGFVLFLPFLAIDLVVASILVSMGMFTLPPIVVSTPLKVLLFVLVDGWNIVVESLARSFVEL